MIDRVRLLSARSTAALLLAFLAWSPAAGATEELEYGWKLKGFAGVILGLFYPDSGEARIVTEDGPGASYTTLLELTSSHREGEYYRYGSEIGNAGAPVRVWSAYQFRGKSKRREREVDQGDVLDFASAIHAIRRDRPSEERAIRLWSEGREYPLTIIPHGGARIECAGRAWTTRHYVIEGRRVEGERFWKGRFQIWIADDERAAPVRIVGEKGLLTVRLDLDEVSIGADEALVGHAAERR